MEGGGYEIKLKKKKNSCKCPCEKPLELLTCRKGFWFGLKMIRKEGKTKRKTKLTLKLGRF